MNLHLTRAIFVPSSGRCGKRLSKVVSFGGLKGFSRSTVGSSTWRISQIVDSHGDLRCQDESAIVPRPSPRATPPAGWLRGPLPYGGALLRCLTEVITTLQLYLRWKARWGGARPLALGIYLVSDVIAGD